MRALRQALAVGKPRDYLSFPLWRLRCWRGVQHRAEADIEPDFVARLIKERSLELDAANSALLDWPWPLRVQTLGQFRVFRDGEPIAFTGKAQRRPLDLLKVVIACGGRDVSEERVIEALWPRIDGDSAHQSFTTTLHRLRKLLGTERAIQLSDGKLTLDGRLIWLDTWAFEQIIVRNTQALRPKPDEATIDSAGLAELAARLLEALSRPVSHQRTGTGVDPAAA